MRANARLSTLIPKAQKLEKLYYKEKNFIRVGATVGVSGETIRQLAHLKGWKIYIHADVQRPTEKDKANIIRLYNSGLSCRKVCHQCGWSGPIVERVVREAGITRHRKTSKKEIAQAKSMYKKGESLKDITRALGRTGLVKHLVKSGLHIVGEVKDWKDDVNWKKAKQFYLSGKSLKNSGIRWRVIVELKIRFPDIDQQRQKARKDSYINKLLEKRNWTLDQVVSYKRRVRNVSAKIIRKHLTHLDPKKLRSREYHIDHKLSVHAAAFKYVKPLPLRIVCHPANMCLVKRQDNLLKSDSSSITKGELIKSIRVFNAKYGDPFKYNPQ